MAVKATNLTADAAADEPRVQNHQYWRLNGRLLQVVWARDGDQMYNNYRLAQCARDGDRMYNNYRLAPCAPSYRVQPAATDAVYTAVGTYDDWCTIISQDQYIRWCNRSSILCYRSSFRRISTYVVGADYGL